MLSARPNVRLSLVGNAPTDAIKQLASGCIEVLGFVPSTAPYLRAAKASIAPLRFEPGIKGRIGEAMSFGVPVVTTSIGGDGFGFLPGVYALVTDDPREFANSGIRLLEDDEYARKVGEAGRRFIEQHNSEAALSQMIGDFVLSDNVVEHLHPNDVIAHLKGALAILKPGGQYLFAVPHRWFGPWDVSKVFKHEVARGMHLKEYTHRELTRAVLAAGFSTVALDFPRPRIRAARPALIGRLCRGSVFTRPCCRPLPDPFCGAAWRSWLGAPALHH